MDNKEAIWRIKDHMIVHSLNEEKAIKITEALEMAIKALEKEDCENAVSAKAVEDMLFALPTYGDSYISLPEFMHEFKKLPPVTPTPVWTRITDRVIPKRVLERALFTFKEEHAAEWKILMKEYGGTGI